MNPLASAVENVSNGFFFPTDVFVIMTNLLVAAISAWLAWVTYLATKHDSDNDDKQNARLAAIIHDTLAEEQRQAHATNALAQDVAQEEKKDGDA